MNLDEALAILAACPKDAFLSRDKLFVRRLALELVRKYADEAIEREIDRINGRRLLDTERSNPRHGQW